MDWLFGCFGGAGKKARKPAASQKAFQRPFQQLPEKVLPSTSIAIAGFTAKEEVTIGKDSLQERNCASHATAKEAGGTIPESLERTPEKLEKGDPWPQLDDLEAELEDLRKQIEQETIDAKKIKEEVTFLRSCGTLLQTPTELRKRDKALEPRQDCISTKGWHSWLVLPSPSKPLCTVPSNSQYADEGKGPVPSPADVTHTVPHGGQFPIIENKKNRVNFNSVFPSMPKHDPAPQSVGHMQEKVDTLTTRSQNSMVVFGHQFKDYQGSASGGNKPRSPCKDVIEGVPSALAKQCSGTPRNENLKSLGGAVVASNRYNSELPVPCTEDAHAKRSSNLKTFEVSSATSSEKEIEESSATLDHVEQVCTINAVHAPGTNEETAPWSHVHSTNFELQGTPRFSKHRYCIYENSDCAPGMVAQSLCTTEITESERCQSSSCHDHVLTSDQKHHNAHEDSVMRFCFVENEDPKFDVSTLSVSMDSEETLTDLGTTVESLVPSGTPQSRLESVTSCEGDDSSSSFYAEETASTSLYSHSSTQNSVAQARRRTAQAARYDAEFDKNEENLLFADSSSHVSAESSHLHNAGENEQIRYIRQENQNLTKTPFKVLQWQDTPKVLQWQDTPEPPRPFGVRSRPSSPVLTPVENAFQWRQLKRKVGNLEYAFASNDMIEAKSGAHWQSHNVNTFTDRSTSESTMDPKWKEGSDENEEPEVWGTGGCMPTHNNMSLPNWLKTPQSIRGGNVENSTTLLRFGDVANAETDSSPWTRKHVNGPCGEFTQSSSDATEPCPVRVDLSLSNWLHVPVKQDEAKGCTAGLVMEQYPARRWNERPILGVVSGDMNSNSVLREVHWDGMGIPNTTTKYKEDQRVNWHATPFEARLERALTRQGKLNEEAETSPASNRLKSLQ